MIATTNELIRKLEAVATVERFQAWVRHDLRAHLPHAALLGTMGNLYGMGSVPTHRISVDFPLTLIEELKNPAGALNDPLLYGWFHSGRLRFLDLGEAKQRGNHHKWRTVLEAYGIRNVLIHGIMDHQKRRFLCLQFFNLHSGRNNEISELISMLITPMHNALWRAVDGCLRADFKGQFCHPTVSLTPAELHIVELLARGLSNKEIARLRGVSDSTVKTQVQKTGAKLGATRRAEIVAIAMPLLSPLPPQTLEDYDEI